MKSWVEKFLKLFHAFNARFYVSSERAAEVFRLRRRGLDVVINVASSLSWLCLSQSNFSPHAYAS